MGEQQPETTVVASVPEPEPVKMVAVTVEEMATLKQENEQLKAKIVELENTIAAQRSMIQLAEQKAAGRTTEAKLTRAGTK